MPAAAPQSARSLAGGVALVTGATGFIGHHLCRELERRGAVVHGVSRRVQPSATSHAVDLSEFAATRALVASVRPDFVFHLASHVTGSRDLANVLPTFDGNLRSSVNLMTALAEFAPQRVVLAGSIEEPSNFGEPPSSPYAAAKRAQTIYAKLFRGMYQLPVVVARIYMVYGPDQPDERKLVPYVTRSLLKGDSPQLGSGTRPVDWVYVDDVVAGLIACATSTDLTASSVEIGTGQLTPVRSVAERIGKIVGRGTPVFGAIADRPAEQVRAADPTLLRELLGRELTDLDEGLRRTVEWYRERDEARTESEQQS